ncbi:MAG: hypothetical protein ACTS3F_06435 [Phycisphaerales bacterium]
MRDRVARAGVVLAVVSLAGLSLVGCSSGNQSRKREFRSNPTPGLVTLSQSHDDVDNQLTVTNNTNVRMISEDFGRAWFMNRPSRLTPRPTPY